MARKAGTGKDKEKITWEGATVSGKRDDIIWGNNIYTWDDVTLLVEIAEVVAGGVQTEFDDWVYQQPQKAKKLIRLICKIKGEKVYDEKKLVEDGIKIHINDARLVVEKVLGKIYFKKIDNKVKTENDDVL